MNIITKKALEIKGTVKAPPSKSYTHRAIMTLALDGQCVVNNPLFCDDTFATIDVCKKLGADIRAGKGFVRVLGFSGLPHPKGKVLNAGESGTLLRFILPIAALGKGVTTISGQGTLLKRSNRAIVEALRAWGMHISGRGAEHKLPIKIDSLGAIPGGVIRVSGSRSSQTVSSLLLAAVFAKKDTTIRLNDRLVSRPYVDVTIDVLKSAGIKIVNYGYRKFFVRSAQKFRPPKIYTVPGDYSSAAFLMALAVLTKSDITITDLRTDKQGDKKIIDILRAMGARIVHTKDRVHIQGPFELNGINIDCGDTPDLVPVLAVLGCFAKGKTKIYNIAHLAHKESNRIIAPARQLKKLGADISITDNSMMVRQSALSPAEVLSCSDHRIAMALVVAGLLIGGVKIKAVECVSKSYPDFFKDVRSLGANFS